jgi:amino acid transporter
VGTTIGSGIFRVPSTVVEHVGTVGASLGVWTLGALISVCGALAVAELAAMYPRSGGIYVFLREAYGPLPAFLFGWTALLVIRPSALGAIALIFGEYLGVFLPLSPDVVRLVAIAIILLVALANYRSVSFAAIVENSTSLAKVLAILALALLAFTLADPERGAFHGPIQASPLSWGGFGLALIGVLWAYDGWADLTLMAGEVRDPGRSLPRALLAGTAIVAIVYLAVNAAYLFALTLPEMAASPLVAADTARRGLGSGGAGLVAGLVLLSTFGALNGALMTGPRIFWAMADDGLLFRPIAAVHPRFRTPHVAIGLATALGILYVAVRSFEQLAGAFVLGVWPFYALSVLAVFILRRRLPRAERPYRTLGYPLVPAVFLAASFLMLLNSAVQTPGSTLFALGVILSGIPVWWLRSRSAGRKRATPT